MKENLKDSDSADPKNQVNLLKNWYKHLDYYKGDIGKRDEVFELFSSNFSTCPICKEINDKSLLVELYLSDDPSKSYIRETLLKLMKHMSPDSKLKIGIPCCSCFKKLYGSK